MVKRGTYSHYTVSEMVLDRARSYPPADSGPFAKPKGLWVSVDGEDDWPSWCRAEEFHLESLHTVYTVTLSGRILELSTTTQMRAFTDRYLIPGEPYRRGIDWDAVADTYDGIVIAPYHGALRIEEGMEWYYGWDCASGCIWNLDAIATMETRASR